MAKVVFLDRDGTLIEDIGYLTKQEQVQILDGACEGVAAMRVMGYGIIVATNQSVIGRGMMTETELHAIHDSLNGVFTDAEARIDSFYYSPYHPEATLPEFRKESECRKPGAGMLLKAATDHDIELSQSFMIGDSERDCTAGKAAGCSTIQILPSSASKGCADADFTATNLIEAAALIQTASGVTP